MNIKKRLRHLAEKSGESRLTGRTSASIKMAKDLGGILIAANLDQAKMLERKNPGLIVKSMETNLDGFMPPFIFDHYAVEELLLKAANKIEALEKKIEELKKDNSNSFDGPTIKHFRGMDE